MTSLINITPVSDFGFDVLRKQASEKKGENIFLSPLSISLALGMTANGANGDTFTAMQKALRLADYGDVGATNNLGYAALINALTGKDIGVTMKIANSIWAANRDDVSFKEAFLKANRDYFKAEVNFEDFTSSATPVKINDWVKLNTAEKITKIVGDSIDPITVMFLINAVYFKGDFAVKFDKALTSPGVFKGTAGDKILPLMYRNGEMRYGSGDGFSAVALPFGAAAGRFSLFVLLPHDGKTAEDIVHGLTAPKFFGVCKSMYETEVALHLPKFEIEFECELSTTLKALGMSNAFSGATADFSRMADGSLFISAVQHKVYARVDEEGAEAAAATSVEIGLESMRMVVPFRVDRPFVALIADEHTGAVAFAGLMNNPEAPKS
jgi:serpin B